MKTKPHPTNDATAQWQTAKDSVKALKKENQAMRSILQGVIDALKDHDATLAASGVSTDF